MSERPFLSRSVKQLDKEGASALSRRDLDSVKAVLNELENHRTTSAAANVASELRGRLGCLQRQLASEAASTSLVLDDETRKAVVVAGGKLPEFKGLLLKWIKTTDRIVNSWGLESEPDFPWWYNERASLSVFAGAVWSADGIAFEEFSSKRDRPRKVSTKIADPRTARIDLRFSWQGEEFIAETKQSWPSVGSGATTAKTQIQQQLDKAAAEVKEVAEDYDRRLAVVFAGPWFPWRQRKDVHGRFLHWKEAFNSVDCDGKAFYWLEDFERTKDSKENNLYPAAAVFIRQVKP